MKVRIVIESLVSSYSGELSQWTGFDDLDRTFAAQYKDGILEAVIAKRPGGSIFDAVSKERGIVICRERIGAPDDNVMFARDMLAILANYGVLYSNQEIA